MFCMKCGTQIPDDANFCYKCGATSIGQAVRITDEPKWEHCEIVYDCNEGFVSGHDFWFWAKAVGTSGTYCAASSTHAKYWYGDGTPNSEWPVHTQLHSELVRKLVADAWEPTGERGNNWWNMRFKRRIKG